jgi:hypothetical protein
MDQTNSFQSLAADLFNIHYVIFPSTLRSTNFPLAFLHKNPVCTSALLRAYTMPHLSHPLCFPQSNKFWLGAPNMKLSITQFSPVSSHCLLLRHIHNPQQPITEHRLAIFVPQSDTLIFTTIYKATAVLSVILKLRWIHRCRVQGNIVITLGQYFRTTITIPGHRLAPEIEHKWTT